MRRNGKHMKKYTIYVQRSDKNLLLYKPTSCHSFTLASPTLYPITPTMQRYRKESSTNGVTISS